MKMKILILALSGIGDALMFTPSIIKLRAEFPAARIEVLCMIKQVAEIYQTVPEVDEVIFFNFIREGSLKSLLFIKNIRKQKYDISISVYPSNRKEYNVINFLVGAKKRCGVKYFLKDSTNFGFLNNVRIEENID
jgi:heptosyltransferase-2